MRSIVRRDTGETYREMLTHVRLSLWLLVGEAGGEGGALKIDFLIKSKD